jgi:competence protein ComEA
VVSQPVRIVVLSLSGFVVAGLVGLGIVQYRADQVAQVAATRPEPLKVAAAPVAASPAAPPPATKKEIWVHVTGAVQKPGVYQLPEGARLAEALTAAGGSLSEGRPDELNLAEVLADGAKVWVPTAAELKPVEGGAPPPVSMKGTIQPVHATAGGTTSGTAKAGGKVNLNTATANELDGLDGIGPTLAARILEYRQTHGPFKSVQDLTKVKGIGTSTLAKFRDRVTV